MVIPDSKQEWKKRWCFYFLCLNKKDILRNILPALGICSVFICDRNEFDSFAGIVEIFGTVMALPWIQLHNIDLPATYIHQ